MYIRYIPYSYTHIHIGGHSYSDYTQGGIYELGFKIVLHFNLWNYQKLDVKTWIQITFFKRIIYSVDRVSVYFSVGERSCFTHCWQ